MKMPDIKTRIAFITWKENLIFRLPVVGELQRERQELRDVCAHVGEGQLETKSECFITLDWNLGLLVVYSSVSQH